MAEADRRPVMRLDGPIRDYAWGSHHVLAQLQGRPAPTPYPEAELWLGAHPAAPARVLGSVDGPATPPREADASGATGSRALDELIADDAERMLGAEVVARFDGQLPFLLKVLAIDQPLSLQLHPSAGQASAGFSSEQAAGIPLDAPERTYRDAWPKPELLCAVSPVDALCGFRGPSASRELLEALAVAELDWLADDLASRGADSLADGVGRLLRWPGGGRAALVAAVTTAADRLASTAGPHAELAGWIRLLGRRHPTDPGVVVALLLNHLRLRPGEAIFVPAGHLHAYLGGVGVEVMSTSDNVLRGGLTAKHVDVDGLLSLLEPAEVDPRAPVRPVDGGHEFVTPAPYFSLQRLLPGSRRLRLDRRGPQILLAIGASVELVADGQPLELVSGQAAFVPASTRSVSVRGDGPLFRAAAGGVAGSVSGLTRGPDAD